MDQSREIKMEIVFLCHFTVTILHKRISFPVDDRGYTYVWNGDFVVRKR